MSSDVKLENKIHNGEIMITKQHINENKPIILKWSKALVDANDDVSEGIKHASADEFLTRIDDQAEFISQIRYIEMDGAKQKDIQHLRINSPLQSMEKITSGSANGSQIDAITDLTEAVPEFLKTTLDAKPFTNYSIVPKTFLKTNVEGEGFMNKMEGLMAPSTAYSIDKIAIFGKRTLADSQGIHALNGLLCQLDQVKTAWTSGHATTPRMPMGEFDQIDTNKELIPQLEKMVEQFLLQKGNRANAVFFISSIIEAKLLAEAGAARATDRSDYFRYDADGNFTLHGIKFITLPVLNDPANDYGEVIILCDPDSVAYAPVEDITSEAEYSVVKKSYITSFDVFFDIALLFPQDVLYADVVAVESSPSSGEH